MDEQTRGFRSAIFGGFNREDVMHYIEETDTKYYTETAELRSQLTEAQSAMNELRIVVDEMETHCSARFWPYPSYGDILFSVK